MGDAYNASRQYLGYLYQARFALLKLFSLPEDNYLLIEKEDDISFGETNGRRTLASLKHKAQGDRLTNQSKDFWKSVRIWLSAYLNSGKQNSSDFYLLFTTAETSTSSFLRGFIDDKVPSENRLLGFERELGAGSSDLNAEVRELFQRLNQVEKSDFLRRIYIVDGSIRIEDIPAAIKGSHMRTIRPLHRDPIYERLEGWWDDLVIKILSNERRDPIQGIELSDKLNQLSEQFKDDNLPIDFRRGRPEEPNQYDGLIFVYQLRAISISEERVQDAILDYYRAYMQRASWARENLLRYDEIEIYEERLVGEWRQYRNALLDDLPAEASEADLKKHGKELYNWAVFQTNELRIRERVTEPYVTRGSYHMLANEMPVPKVYWHPHFLTQIKSILEGSLR